MDSDMNRLVEATKVLAESLDSLSDKHGRGETARMLRVAGSQAWQLYHFLRDVSKDTQ